MLWIMNVAKMERTMRGLVRVARRPDGRGGTLGDDPRLAEAIGRLATDTAAIRCLGYRGFAKSVRGEMPPEHMVLKLFSSEAEQRACLLGPRRPRDSRASTSTVPGRTVSPSGTWRTSIPARSEVMGAFYDGAWADAVPAFVLRHDRRRDLRDPAQHHRRARARACRGADGQPRAPEQARRPDAPAERCSGCASRRSGESTCADDVLTSCDPGATRRCRSGCVDGGVARAECE